MENTPVGPVGNNDNAWFNELDVPSPIPPKKSHKHLMMIVGAILIVGILGAAITMLVSTNQRTACLSSDDYTTLTGTTLTDNLSPTTNFYASTIAFQEGSTAYDDTDIEGAQGEKLLQKIAQLYKDQNKTSFIINLGGSYYTQAAAELAQKRMTAVQATLVGMGVAASDIQSITPAYNEPEEADDAPQDNVTTTLSIVSNQACI